MRTNTLLAAFLVGIALVGTACVAREQQWAVHDMDRPRPPVITPGEGAAPPSDAIVLFDGTDLSQWINDKTGGVPGWKIENGYVEIVPKSGSIHTKQAFGDMQLHLEWAAPTNDSGTGQAKGNSGIYVMNSRYEVQVLDSYQNDTYPDGQAASAYGQNPPLINASRPAGQWQTYDIVFHRPRFNGKKVVQPATVTVLHNGVLAQDHWEFSGPTAHMARPSYSPHPDKLPLVLQEHSDKVRYRNIWVRPLE